MGKASRAVERYRVPTDGTFRVKKASTRPPKDLGKKARTKEALVQRLDELRGELTEIQSRLFADDRHSLLIVFQALDAAGKDGTLKAVMSGVNPAGCQVFSFKQPSSTDLDHDFLWRAAQSLPERGRIGIFNRSYYEEVLVVRVHPEFLEAQRLPDGRAKGIWKERYRSINEFERHLTANGTTVLKFWLHVSKDEQRRRFLERLNTPEKNWKFSSRDIDERARWGDYMAAYEDALNATSTESAPWFVIPADDKAYMRVCVSEIIVHTLKKLGLRYPEISEAQRAEFDALRTALESEG